MSEDSQEPRKKRRKNGPLWPRGPVTKKGSSLSRKAGYLPPDLAWLPNWRNIEEYPFDENTSGKQWAWEFLRRNPRYRNLREATVSQYADKPELLEIAKGSKAIRTSELLFKIIKDIPESENLSKIISMFNREFGLLSFPPDTSEQFPEIEFEKVKIISGPKGAKNSSFPISIQKDQILCILDLSMPIEQIEFIRREFVRLRKDKKVKVHKILKAPKNFDKTERPANPIHNVLTYITYLRIIDARERFEKNNTIAAGIFPELYDSYDTGSNGSDRVQKNYEAAMKIVESDFRVLAIKGR